MKIGMKLDNNVSYLSAGFETTSAHFAEPDGKYDLLQIELSRQLKAQFILHYSAPILLHDGNSEYLLALA